jgi:hypothetical protein
MKKLSLTVFAGFLLLLGVNTFAQDEPTKGQISVDYSLVRFEPAQALTSGHNLNGGGGAFTYFLHPYLGLKADLQGYGSTTFPFSIPVATVNPLIAGVAPGTYRTQGNMFTYLFGPVIRKPGKIEPFGEILWGGAHSNVYTNFITASQATVTASPNAFAMIVGGGLDIRVNRRLSFRPFEVDYLLTRFSNPIAGTQNQNSFRYTAGAAINW